MSNVHPMIDVTCPKCGWTGRQRASSARAGRRPKHACRPANCAPEWLVKRAQWSIAERGKGELTARPLADAIWERFGPFDEDAKITRKDRSLPLSPDNCAVLTPIPEHLPIMGHSQWRTR